MTTKSEKQAQAVPEARNVLRQSVLHYLNHGDWRSQGMSARQVADLLKAPLDLVEEVLSEVAANEQSSDETCESCGKPADTWDNLESCIPLCSDCKKDENEAERERTTEKLRIRAYIELHPGMGALEVIAAATELKCHPTMIREVMSDMISEHCNGFERLSDAALFKDKPIEISFERATPKNDPLMTESTDATMERLKQVSDKPVEKYLKSRKPKSTREALGVVDPHNPRDPSEYEWAQVDWNLEACYAGWGVMGFRVMGKRQMHLFIPLAAVHRALAICPEASTYREPEAPEADAREPLSFKPGSRGEFKSVLDALVEVIQRERGY